MKRNRNHLSATANIRVGKIFLYSLILSVGFASFLGIMVLLSLSFGDVQIKVLLSTLSISGASLCGFAAGMSLEKNRIKILGWAGISLSLIGCAGVVCGIWTEVAETGFWKFASIAWMWGAACSHASLLSLAGLKKTFIWAKYGGVISTLALAAVLSGCILAENFGWFVGRVIGILSIFIAALSICVPIFHRLSRSETPVSIREIDQEIQQLQARLQVLENKKGQLT